MNNKKLILTSMSLMTSLSFLYGFSNDSKKEDFKVMSSSYSQPLTSIQIIENSKIIKTKRYTVSGAEKISNGLIFNKYGRFKK